MVDGLPVEALRDACMKAGVTRAVIVGSAATGDGWDARRSDLDLYVDGLAGAALQGLAQRLADIAGRTVDLSSASDPITAAIVSRNWRHGERLV